jgi:arylsulfatase A-like enzyme
MGHYSRWLREQAPELVEQVPGRVDEGKLTDLIGDAFLSPIPHELHYTGWLADRFIDWMGQRERPFCAFVGFPGPHHPFAPSEDVWDRFKDAPVREPVDFAGESLAQRPCFTESVGFHPSVTLPQDIDLARTVRRLTSAMVWQIDQAVGRILQALEDAGAGQDTIIVFTSDHGDFLGDLGLLRKQTTADERLLHVPFIMRAPGQDLADLAERPMGNADVLPTLAAMAGVELPEPVHGRDIRAAGEDHRAFAVAPQSHHVVDRTLDNYTCWDGRYRATWYPHREQWELFDHDEDPDELHNLAGERPEVIEGFRRRIAEQHMRWTVPSLGRLAPW